MSETAASRECSQPSGALGVDAAPACRCGAGAHPELEDRCAAGHVVTGNGLALVTGSRSVAFWSEHAQAREELTGAIVADAGHTLEDAPRALTLAADSLAQATLIRDSAYLRLVESGGPLTSSGRARRAFDVWGSAVDRVERHLRLLGLRRVPRPVPTLRDYLQRSQDAPTGSRGAVPCCPAAADAGERGADSKP